MRPGLFRAALAPLLAVLALPLIPSGSQASAEAQEAHAAHVVPAGVERVVVGDMVVDWIGGAPEGAAAALAASDVPAELTIAPDDHDHDTAHAPAPTDLYAAAAEGTDGEVTYEHAAASGGFALFSSTARWLSTGYTIRLSGGDGRIEQYRNELTEAARAATAMTGVPIRVAPAFGGPTSPGRGEIVVVLGTGPCGPGVGCGGPGMTYAELVHGRVWIGPSALGLTPAKRANVAAHELGHALGLQHYGGSWTDGHQVMYPVVTGAPPFRAGDTAGLRRMAGADDRPAGAMTSRAYAAGWANVAGTVASGSKVRISSGSIAHVVTAKAGRFHGAIPLPAGTHVVCATSMDAAPGFRRDIGCGSLVAPGRPVARVEPAIGSFRTIRIGGWAVDPQSAAPVIVQIRRNGAVVTTIRADQHREDLGPLAHSYGTQHGFAADVPAIAGHNRLCVRVLGIGAGGDLNAGCIEVVHAVDPTGNLDRVHAEGLGATLSGWALDPNTRDPVLLTVRVDGEVPAVGGTVRASQNRPDVARSHPAHGPGHGFTHLVPMDPGSREVCVTVVNVGLGKDRSLGCAQVVVQDPLRAPVPVATATVDQAKDVVIGAVTAPGRLAGDLQATVIGR